MEREMNLQSKIETVTPESLALIDHYSGLMKLYFTICTGAVVLFVNAIFIAHVSLWALFLLAASTFSFGLTALLCLSLMTELISFRREMVEAAIRGAVPSEFNQRIDDWNLHISGTVRIMARIFNIAIIFAAASIAAVCVTRLSSAILRH